MFYIKKNIVKLITNKVPMAHIKKLNTCGYYDLIDKCIFYKKVKNNRNLSNVWNYALPQRSKATLLQFQKYDSALHSVEESLSSTA